MLGLFLKLHVAIIATCSFNLKNYGDGGGFNTPKKQLLPFIWSEELCPSALDYNLSVLNPPHLHNSSFIFSLIQQQAILQLCAQCPSHWLEATMAVTLFCHKPYCFSYVNDHVHWLLSMRIPQFAHEKKVKQGHCQPRFYSKARALSTQLYNFPVENMLVTVYFIWTLRMKS